MKTLIVITKKEFDSKILRALYPDLDFSTSDVVLADDLLGQRAGQTVETVLSPINDLLKTAKAYEKVYCTAYAGVGLKLVQYIPNKVGIFIYNLLIFELGCGKIATPIQLSRIELEARLLKLDKENFLNISSNLGSYVEHYLCENSNTDPVNYRCQIPSELNNLNFIFLPGDKTTDPSDFLIGEDEYLDWVKNGTVPTALIKED